MGLAPSKLTRPVGGRASGLARFVGVWRGGYVFDLGEHSLPEPCAKIFFEQRVFVEVQSLGKELLFE